MRTLFKALTTLIASLAASAALAAYPERPITLIVPWGAGGGTDAVARILATLMEKDLGQPINVVNRTGGSGVVGHQAISAAPPDGYTIGIITVEIGMMHHQGLTDLKGSSYTPIALVNADPAGIQVRADAPYKNVGDLVAAIKANPGKFKASGTGQGGIWHLAIAGFLRDQKVDPAALPWVPSNGAAPGLNDLVAGGVEVVPCSLPEARALIEAGKVKSLAVMDPQPASLFPKVPTLKAETGSALDDGGLARHRGAEGLAGRHPDQAARVAAEGARVQGVQGVHDQPRLRRVVGAAGGVRFVHGQVGCRSRRHDEGRGHRQVASA